MIDRAVKDGVWKKQEQGITTRELLGKTIGIVGMGSIGRTLARLLKAFKVNVLYYDQYRLDEEQEETLDITYTDLKSLLRQADIITLHCPMTEQTRHLICRKTLAWTKNGVILVNTARGGLVNEEDLVEALKIGKVGCAGLDVFETEPVSQENKLLCMKNVITTPHIAGVTVDSFQAMMKTAMGNIQQFDKGNLDVIERFKYMYD